MTSFRTKSSAGSIAALLFFLMQPIAAWAAEIFASSADGMSVVTVKGEIELGDDQKFAQVAQRFVTAVVIFDSPGGNLFAGMAMGEAIRLKAFATAVGPSSVCASSCALAWLGGAKRFVAPSSKLGFHSAYKIEGAQARETGLGNAVVGAYLTRIGLPLDAVVYITKAAPDSMTWLTPEDGKKVGIEFSILEGNSTQSAPASRQAAEKIGPPLSGPLATSQSQAARYTMVDGRVTALSGLSSDCDSHAPLAELSGKLVKVEYENDAISLRGLVIEGSDGARKFVNVKVPDNLDMATVGWVKTGLQTLLRQDRYVVLDARLCGAAGRFLWLDGIRSSEARSYTSATASASEDSALAARVAKNFHQQYKAAGMAGLRASVEACYQRAHQTLKLSAIKYCYLLDQLASGLDAAASQRFGIRQDEFWVARSAVARTAQVLARMNQDNPANAQILKDWASLATAAWKELDARLSATR